MDTWRKHPIHQPIHEVHHRPVIVFVTVCAKDRKPILANPQAHAVLTDSWRAAEFWNVGRYVIMPDHLHLFCAPAELEASPLMKWVRFWKSHAARSWPRPNEAPVWQRHFWDTQLRRSESYTEKWSYVEQNPVRAGLVARAEDWPFKGELHQLRW